MVYDLTNYLFGSESIIGEFMQSISILFNAMVYVDEERKKLAVNYQEVTGEGGKPIKVEPITGINVIG